MLVPFFHNTGSTSNIWKDICSVGHIDSGLGFSIREGFKVQVNSGQDTLLWDHIWLGDNAIREDFPRLCLISNKKDEVISSVCVEVGDGSWDLRFKRGLRVYVETRIFFNF